jgi:hypothetical protein
VLNVCLLDLNNGTVAWFNSSRSKNAFGSAGADCRSVDFGSEAARRWLFLLPRVIAV